MSFDQGYLLSLLDQLSNLALNSLAVKTWYTMSVMMVGIALRPEHTLQTCALLLAKV
jgi:hypothetical protein